VIRVYRDWDKLQVVAAVHGVIAPDDYARQLCRVGLWFNQARLGIENNKIYEAVRTALREDYPNLFWHGDPMNPRSKTRRAGWRTDDKSRRMMLSVLRAHLRDGELECYDLGLPQEMATFVPGPTGKWEAQRGSHDDRILGLAIGAFLAGLRGARGRRRKKTLPVRGPEQGDEGAYASYLREQAEARRRRGGGRRFFSLS